MVKAKRQRKQWRKIDTQEVEDYLEKSTREERQGLNFEKIPDADLFFEDKAPDDGKSTEPEIKLPKKLAARQKMTRAQAILAGAQKAAPLSSVPMKKQKTTPAEAKVEKLAANMLQKSSKNSRNLAKKKPEVEDLWEQGPEAAKMAVAVVDPSTGLIVNANKRRKKESHPAIKAPAVEIDAPGCSFNPDRELHQDAVAEAVAVEMKKIYDKELEPTAPLAVVDYDPEEDELAMLQVDAAEDEEEMEESEEEEEETERLNKAAAAVKKKKTQKDRNRELRRKAEEEELARRRKEKKQRHELANLKKIKGEVEETLAEREERLARRYADLEEKAAAAPPRLGKQKFEPMPLQVMTTDEIEETGGSLRKLKPTAMLAKDRFKSLQRRGIIEPRKKALKSGKKKVEFIHGERAGKAKERQAEVEELRAGNKKVKTSGGAGVKKRAGGVGRKVRF